MRALPPELKPDPKVYNQCNTMQKQQDNMSLFILVCEKVSSGLSCPVCSVFIWPVMKHASAGPCCYHSLRWHPSVTQAHLGVVTPAAISGAPLSANHSTLWGGLEPSLMCRRRKWDSNNDKLYQVFRECVLMWWRWPCLAGFEGSLVDKDLFIFYCLHMLW